MSSQTDILNLALYKLAQSQTIPAVMDESKAATIAVRVWQHALDLVLSERAWDFAMKSLDAALDVDPPAPGWGFATPIQTTVYGCGRSYSAKTC